MVWARVGTLGQHGERLSGNLFRVPGSVRTRVGSRCCRQSPKMGDFSAPLPVSCARTWRRRRSRAKLDRWPDRKHAGAAPACCIPHQHTDPARLPAARCPPSHR